MKLTIILLLVAFCQSGESNIFGQERELTETDLSNEKSDDENSKTEEDYVEKGTSDEEQSIQQPLTLSNARNRSKRYPEHLDPNLEFSPFWIRIGECPLTSDGTRQHFCPTPTADRKWVCVDDYQLCDGVKNCPHAEDESSFYCMFYKSLKQKVNEITRSMSEQMQIMTAAMEDFDKIHQASPNRKHQHASFLW